MSRETRTKRQIDANKLDLEIFRVVQQVYQFAEDHSDADAREMASHFDGYRGRIRRHMHPKDVEGTR